MDLDLIKQRRRELLDKINRNVNIWKPMKGANKIRVLPYKKDKDNPFIELYWHWNLGRTSVLCLEKNFGEKCPVCQLATKLWNSDVKEDKDSAKKIFARLRFYVPMVQRGQEEDGPKYWAFGQNVYDDLTGATEDPDCGDFTDIEIGRDVIVTYRTPEETGTTFGKISAKVAMSQSVLTQDKEILKKLINDQVEIEEIYPRKTKDEIVEILEEWLNPSKQEEKEEAEKLDSTTPKKDKSTAKDKITPSLSLKDEFDKLFEED